MEWRLFGLPTFESVLVFNEIAQLSILGYKSPQLIFEIVLWSLQLIVEVVQQLGYGAWHIMELNNFRNATKISRNLFVIHGWRAQQDILEIFDSSRQRNLW